ncbi:MAG: hypothetical protein ACK5TK_02970 [Betaproteobacteria bacterium]
MSSHSPAANEDPSIPVLTERLPATPAASAPPPSAPPPPAATGAPPGNADAQRAALAQLAVRLPATVEALAAQHVEAAIEGATERLAEQLRTTVAAAVRDSVRAALADELERLRKSAATR